jgi:hypothetical protein
LTECELTSNLLEPEPELSFSGRYFRRLSGDFEAVRAAGGVVVESRCATKTESVSIPAFLCPWSDTQRELVASGGSVVETHQILLDDQGRFTTVSDAATGELINSCVTASADGRDGAGVSTFLPDAGSCPIEPGTDLELRAVEDDLVRLDRPTSCVALLRRRGGRPELAIQLVGESKNPSWSVGLIVVVDPGASPQPLECCTASESPWTLTADLEWTEDGSVSGPTYHPLVSGSASFERLDYDAGGWVKAKVELAADEGDGRSWTLHGTLNLPVVRDASWLE